MLIYCEKLLALVPVLVSAAMILKKRKCYRKASKELDQDEAEMVSAPSTSQAAEKSVEIPDDRYKHFMRLLYKLIQEKYQVFNSYKAVS